MYSRPVAALVFCLLPAYLAAASPDELIQLILRNDIAGLKAQLQNGADANARGERETSLLMYAAGFGSLEAMQALIANGANVNSVNAQKASALIWGAYDIEKVRFLLSKGAEVNAASALGRQAIHIAASGNGGEQTVPLLIKNGANPNARDARNNTTLLFAAFADNVPLMRMLIDKGVDVNAAGKIREWTPLMIAAGVNDLDAVRLLISKGADVNKVTAEHQDGTVKNGPINTGHMTALMYAAPHGSPALIQALLSAKADPNAKDVRGMTPLMLAVASEQQNPGVVKLLLGGGADSKAKDTDGETAGDWARKFGRPSTMRLLNAKEISPSRETPTAVKVSAANGDVRKAAERSLTLLESTSTKFFEQGGCTACHHSDLTMFAAGVTAAHGIHADESALTELMKEEKTGWSARVDSLMQRFEAGGEVEQIAYAMLGFAAMKYPLDPATGAMATELATAQNPDGSWRRVTFARTPVQDTDIVRTALAAHGLRSFTPPARQTEFDERVARAAAWLSRAMPADTEDRAMQLLGLTWTGASRDVIRKVAGKLQTTQQPGGGWRQNDYLEPDAYATGLVLYALHEAGALAPTDPAYRRGVNFLLSTQASDGSWHVKSRAVRLQPYFQSGFPYDHDQWISAAATAWATAALGIGADQAVVASIK